MWKNENLFLECFSVFISAFFYHLTFNICQVTILTFSKLGQCQFKTFLRWILSRARKLIIKKWKKNVGVGNVATATTATLFLHTVVSTKLLIRFLACCGQRNSFKTRKSQKNFFLVFNYSCNIITTTFIQISRHFYFGFFSKTNHQIMI